MSKKSRIDIFTKRKPCGMPIAGKGFIFPKNDRFKELFALLDFETMRFSKSQYLTCPCIQNIRYAPKANIAILYRGAGGRGDALRSFGRYRIK